MQFTKEVPTKLDTEFACVWVYNKQVDCNCFKVEEDGIKILDSDGYYYVEKHKDDDWPWTKADDWDITIQETS